MSKRPLRRRRWGWLLWVALILLGGAFGLKRYRDRPQKTLDVRVAVVARGRVRELVSTVAAGRVTAEREATIRAEIAGVVTRMPHRRGAIVQQGDILLEYDPRELRERVSVASAAVALSRAQAAQAQASAVLAGNNARRAAELRDRGVGAAVEAETLSGSAGVALRAADAARIGGQQAQANVRVAQLALRHAVLRAPFSGVLLTRAIEVGEVTTPGAPLFTLADVSRLHVDAELDEADLGRVRVGMRSEITLDAYSGDRLSARLSEIAPSVTRDVRGSRSIAVRFELSPDPRLRVGMSAEADVIVATQENVLWIPPNAVMGRGIERAVYVVDAGGVARRRTVRTGMGTWEALEVTQGLALNDRVIVTLSNAELQDGVLVRVRSDESTPSRGASR
ncbi:MAG: efflux RND transporter periplasmic adaptor subunit [Deltaproteobacteria bacterium]|nr:efflux RND transporter periplasmic adaptor subunit [Deltaproteobacteria bacterium]